MKLLHTAAADVGIQCKRPHPSSGMCGESVKLTAKAASSDGNGKTSLASGCADLPVACNKASEKKI